MTTKSVNRGKISLYSIFLALIFCSAGIGAAAANPSVSINPSVTDVDFGDPFSVFIEVNPDGMNVESILASLTYDETKASVTNVILKSADFPVNDPGTQSPGLIQNIMGLNTQTGGVTTVTNLAEIQMTAIDEGTFVIGISGSLTQPPGDPLTPVDWNPGQVNINVEVPDTNQVPNVNVTIKPSTQTICNDTDFSIFIEVNPNSTTSVESVLASITYDQTKASVTNVILNSVNFPVNSPGTQTSGLIQNIMGLNTLTSGLTTTANLAEIQMTAIDVGTFSIAISSSLTTPPGDTITPVDLINGQVTVEICEEDPDEPETPDAIDLYKGWNLFSVPHVLNDSSVLSLTEGFSPGAAVIYYDASGIGWGSVTDVEPLKAYLIYVTDNETLVNLEAKPVPAGSLAMYVGWNLLGMTGYSPAMAEDALNVSEIDDSYQKIMNWDNYDKRFNLYGYNCNDDWSGDGDCPPPLAEHVTTQNFPMKPYAGYWINMAYADVYTGQG